MQISKILIILILLGSFSAQAENACSYLFFEESIGNDFDYNTQTQAIDHLLGNLKKPAPTIEIGQASQYDSETKKITIALGKGMSVFLAHEYGHAILDNNIEQTSNVWKNISEEIDQQSEIEKMIQLQANRGNILKTKLMFTESSEEAEYVNELIVDAGKKFNGYKKMLSNIQNAKLIQMAYHELFADVTAVIQFKDPNIIYKTLLITEPERQSESLKINPNNKETISSEEYHRRNFDDRRFDKVWNKANLKQWLQDMDVSLKADFIPPYQLLAPAKSAFWTIVKSRVQNPEEQRKLLSEFYEIVQHHFETNFPNLESMEKVHPLELNKSLIQMFKDKWNN